MIQPQTRLRVADNSGAKEIMCFHVVGGSVVKTANIGDIIKASVKSATPDLISIAIFSLSAPRITLPQTLTSEQI